MKRILLLFLCHLGLLSGGRLFADVVTLKDGRQISGSVESGNTQELHIKVGDQSQTIDVHELQAIQFGDRSPAPATAPAASEPAPAQPNTLILNDGTHVNGRWWSLDATDMHFLVNNQLQHYPRHDVVGVAFDNGTLPPPPARPAPPPATPAQPSPGAAQPVRPPTPARSPDRVPPRPPALARPAGSAPSAPSRGVSQPEEIGAVYFWNGKDLTPLEHNHAAQGGRGATQYWEMPGPKSPVRIEDASAHAFIVRLAKGVPPDSYSLYVLSTVDGSRRTRSQPERRGGLVTWPFKIEINDESGYMTYAFIVRDLPTGEYSFSPSNSNDAYCFGVDPSAPGQ